MENKTSSQYIAVAYKLYSKEEDGNTEMIEEATAERPFVFISGFNIALNAFEQKMLSLKQGEAFDFTLGKEDAYGDYDEEAVQDLDKNIFCVDGIFDSKHVKVGADLPMQNEQGQRFMGHVVEITDQHVKLDFNHPLAGLALRFEGHVVESREATTEEIQQMINQLSGGCGGCGGGCEGGGCEGGGCGGGGCCN